MKDAITSAGAIHFWSRSQVRKLLISVASHYNGEVGVAAAIMWRAGLRIGETVALEWVDVDYARGVLEVRGTDARPGRAVPLHADLYEALERLKSARVREGPLFTVSTRTVMRQIRLGMERVGLDQESTGTGVQKAGAESLRHSAAVHWLSTGVPVDVVSRWLGHSSPVVTRRVYQRLAESRRSMEGASEGEARVIGMTVGDPGTGGPVPSVDGRMTASDWWSGADVRLLPGEGGGATVFEISFSDGCRYIGHTEMTVFGRVDDLVASPWDERRNDFVADHCARMGSVVRVVRSGLNLDAATELQNELVRTAPEGMESSDGTSLEARDCFLLEVPGDPVKMTFAEWITKQEEPETGGED